MTAHREGTTRTEHAPIKVSAETHRRLRIAAAVEGRTMGELVADAVEQFLVAHRDEIEAGLGHAREVLVRG